MSNPKLSAAQMVALAPYERNFKTAVEARWSSLIPASGIDTMEEVWAQITGTKRNTNRSCNNCVLNLVYDLGVIYFETKEARARQAEKKAENKAETPKKAGTTAKKGKAVKTGK